MPPIRRSRQPDATAAESTESCETAELAEQKVEVRRSRRRRRTVSAYRDGDTVIVLMPAHIPAKDEAEWVTEMVRRLDRGDRRRRPTDEALTRRARVLMRKYLPRDVSPASVRWVTNQNARWGSCTPIDRTIRLSHRLQQMPQYVIDYVLLHELAHLIEADHGPRFHALMAAYPQAERARGFLEGWSTGTQTPLYGIEGLDAIDDTVGSGDEHDIAIASGDIVGPIAAKTAVDAALLPFGD